jgi:hypothetical protein
MRIFSQLYFFLIAGKNLVPKPSLQAQEAGQGEGHVRSNF